jgi:putative peptide zinc metalloprotease protein
MGTQESLFSPLWYRVAEQHPHLRAEVRVHRQQMREQRWYLLINAANGRQFRINQKAYEFIGRCDGRLSVQQIWDELVERLRDDAPTQSEVIHTLSELDEQELIASDTAPEAQNLVRRRDEREQKKVQGFVNPFALRIPLGNPSPLLKKLERIAPALFSRFALFAWLLMVAVAAVFAASNWTAIGADATAYMNTPRHILLAWLCFPIIKGLHELAHGLAVRRWGGEVLEAGFSLFVLVPAPYVDASASAAFAARYQRLAVAASGIMIELGIAAVALAVWLNVQPGVVRDVAFVTMFIASVSTVVFNANPLLRFDGYYILCDALHLPNLDTRSKAWWMQATLRVLGDRSAMSQIELAAGELKWLVAYAPLAFVYRVAIAIAVVIWLGSYSATIGFITGLILAATIFARPLWGAFTRVRDSIPAGKRRKRAAVIAGVVANVLVILVCTVPVPFHTVASAVVWPPEQARLRIATEGFIVQLLARDGQGVAAGEMLVKLDDPALFAEREKLTSRIEQLQAGRFTAAADNMEQARNAEEELTRAQSDLARIEGKIANLVVRAPSAGTLVMMREADLPGTFLRQGETIGYVLERADVSIRVAVPEYDAALVRDGIRRVEVRTADTRESVQAQLVRDIPAATFELPSVVLGDRGGGPHATDPADKDGLRTRDPVVLIDLTLPAKKLDRIGTRAWVRFDHGAQPLAERWYRQGRQVLLQHFNPAS